MEETLLISKDLSPRVCLKELNSRGLVPGPLEKEKAFFSRIENLEALDGSKKSSPCCKATKQIKAFDFSIDWMPISYTDKNLSFFEAGALFVDAATVKLQLSKKFLQREKFFVEKTELLSHEAVHAMRWQFREPQFEEIFAYRTSKKKWRRFFGPLFREPKEAVFFLLAVTAGSFLSIFHPLFCFLSIALLGGFLGRLAKDQKVLEKCILKLSEITTEDPLNLAVRLTDKEVKNFAKSTPEQILSYVFSQKSLRWKMLQESYGIS